MVILEVVNFDIKIDFFLKKTRLKGIFEKGLKRDIYGKKK